MRISDWSSDVCSSDLDDSGVYVAVATSTICVNRTQPSPSQQLSPPMPKKKPSTDDSFATAPVDKLTTEQAVVALVRLAALVVPTDRPQERNSHLHGESVSVREALGGRRTHQETTRHKKL